MSQFNLLNEINSLIPMDGPMTRGPLPRWQKKALEGSRSVKNSSSSLINISNLSFHKLSLSTTHSANTSSAAKSPGDKKKKTPAKRSPGRSHTTTPNNNKTPNSGGDDRFIPSRSNSNFDLCHYMTNNADNTVENNMSPTQEAQSAMEKALSEGMNVPNASQQRLLQYNIKAPAAPEGHQNPLRIIYSQSKAPSTVKASKRYIPQAADRILDAPDIIDDYYLNLLDWSASNILAVALGNSIYLWNAGTGQIEELLTLEGSDHVCSLAWIQGGGSHLAIGITNGTTELWDCDRTKRLRIMEGHSGRVGSLSWNSYVLSSGSRSGTIVHHDVRDRDHIVSTLNAHTQEVCGLKWSPDGRFLASGGNDNLLNIWASVSGEKHSQTQPLYTFNQHMAAVKGLAWCPWSPGILASGGGTADRTIRLWNVNNGTNLNTVDTRSQVCSILWSQTYKELISGHGYANNQLIIWKYPVMTKVAELTGHTARVLHLAMSPDGTTVLSAGADETLRLWNCFVPDPAKSKAPEKLKSAKSIFKQSIR
ncbi:cell division cycle 20 protein fzy isoform X2 [Arctopsyche grandis]|uniref:cell division cycle 20 protein fzy isoform X2 n=1 Tax=Arctopsyche grandis TaxID=121162 RepID=UPI00406D9090